MEFTTSEAERAAAAGWWMFLVAGIAWILFAWVVLSFNYTTV